MSDIPVTPSCATGGFTGSLPDKHVEFTHSAINAQWDEVRKRDAIVKALRDIIKAQHKSQMILDLRRENGRLKARNAELARDLDNARFVEEQVRAANTQLADGVRDTEKLVDFLQAQSPECSYDFEWIARGVQKFFAVEP